MKPFTHFLTILLRLASLGLILTAGGLAYTQYRQFVQVRAYYPAGSIIAGIPMGGLNRQQALERLIQAYGIPIELQVGKDTIQVRPEVLGFELDLTGMLVEAEVQRTNRPAGEDFWDYLWDRVPTVPLQIPLRATGNEDRIRAYLKNEIASRYDQPTQAPLPDAGTLTFKPGNTGSVLNIEQAVPQISEALHSLTARRVELAASQVSSGRPALKNLQVMLSQVINLSHFDGISEIYLQDLQSHQELDFAYQNGKTLPAGIAFTAASTIKIPIMITTYRRIAEPGSAEVMAYLEKMIAVSENDPADSLMKLLDKNNGPLEVTRDIQALGLKNTFLAGYFFPGAPLLQRFNTSANQRKDYSTDPDPYNQTTPAEVGQLLADIYQCAENKGGAFAEVFPGQITQNECKQMVEFLVLNKLPVLITAGLPEGTKIAHKHGWIEELDGIVRNFSDAAIVYTPGGDYVLTVYLWNKDQLLFDNANALTADLSQVIYNYFNIVEK